MAGADSTHLEVEVKFLVEDLPQLRERLLTAGAILHKARVYERNVRFDTADEALLGRWELLRLRQDTAVRLTFKGPAPTAQPSEAKVREELEVEVSDFDTMSLIIQRLGLRPLQIYEKYRETFQFDGVEVVLDELPYGNFVELEGSEKGIKKVAFLLGLDWRKRILLNYLGLMAQLKNHHQLPFNDLTFANFNGLSVSISDLGFLGLASNDA